MTTTTIQKWGNSQGIRIPKFILDAVHWNNNDELLLKTDNDRLIIQRAEKRKNIIELFDDFDGEYIPCEVSWGEPVGEEVW